MARVIAIGHVDDHPAIRDGLAAAVGRTDDIRILDVGADRAALQRMLVRPDLDILVSDILLSSEPALFDALLSRGDVARPAVLIYSGFAYPSFLAAAIERGASGYIRKDEPVEAVVTAIRRIADGGVAYDRSALAAARSSGAWPRPDTIELIRLVASGASNGEIATRLQVTEDAVESRLRRLYLRHGVLGRAELAVTAVRQGWIVSES
jgi:two-component system response regulator DesR